MKILIVDDEPQIAMILQAIVKNATPAESRIAFGYREALKLLESFRPDLSFLDVNLGDGNGYDILRLLADKKQGKVVMMSAYTMDEESRNVSGRGAEMFIPKPFTKDKIIHVLKQLEFIK